MKTRRGTAAIVSGVYEYEGDRQERTVRELFAIYRRGWQDGAASRVQRPDHISHPTRPDLSESYRRGYDAGRDAYTRAMGIEADRLGYNVQAAIIDR